MILSCLPSLCLALVLFCFHVCGVHSFDNSRSDNLAVYWGQNSYGGSSSNTADWQKTLSFYYADDSIDIFPLAFVNVFFGTGNVPSLDLSNICSTVTNTVFNGTAMPDCSFLASDIKTCQSKGKAITISFGGATGAGVFTTAQAASDYADLIWNIFLGGTSDIRPFGDAVLDGIDLDIEGGSTTYYDSFVKQLQTHYTGADKKYYLTAAPQCPFPDAYLGTLLNEASFDAVYVQFYNNYCSVQTYSNAADWNFGTWDDWAKTKSPNPDVKIYIGAPASTTAANPGSYVDVDTLGKLAIETRTQYSSFGGIMLWDASVAYMNNRFDSAIKGLISSSGGGSSSTTTPQSSSQAVSSSTSQIASSTPLTTSSTPHTTLTSTTSTPAGTPTTSPSTTTPTGTSTTSSSITIPTGGSVSCTSASAWSGTMTYTAGMSVTYNGHLYKAKRASYGFTPGRSALYWIDEGLCSGAGSPTPTLVIQKRAVCTLAQ